MAKEKREWRIGALTSLRPSDPECNFLERYVELGYPCMQMWDGGAGNRDLIDPHVLRRRAASLGLELVSLGSLGPGHLAWNFTYGPQTQGIVPPELREERVRNLIGCAEYAAEAGIPAILTHAGFLPENYCDPEFPGVVEALRRVASRCASLGITFLFETGQETPVALLRHIRATGFDNLGINLDTANLIMYGKGNPIDALKVYAPLVKSIHAKDGLPPTGAMGETPNGPVELLGPEVPIGQGSVDFERFLPALAATGFDGPILIEREVPEPQRTSEILVARDYIRSILAKI